MADAAMLTRRDYVTLRCHYARRAFRCCFATGCFSLRQAIRVVDGALMRGARHARATCRQDYVYVARCYVSLQLARRVDYGGAMRMAVSPLMPCHASICATCQCATRATSERVYTRRLQHTAVAVNMRAYDKYAYAPRDDANASVGRCARKVNAYDESTEDVPCDERASAVRAEFAER